uniref:gliding motility-associated C-terminal domain-containing protein n=1 Tax=Flavobacterium sp. TaxID=239 RepID=UPI00262743F1
DNCDSQVSVLYNQVISGQNDGCAAEYTITRTWSVSDCAGNSASHTQTINVEDNTNPVFVGQLPANATVQCDAVPAAPILTATDNCDSQVSVIYNQVISGQNDGCAAEYTITRTWSVSDCAGNSASHTQTINVEDNTNPVFVGQLPANATVQCDAVPAAPVLTATDNCDSQVSVVYNQVISGQNDGCAAEYTITRTWSVSDCAGNSASHTQTINVEDNTNPVFVGQLPANATVQCDAVPAAPVITASDNCDAQVQVVYTESFKAQDDDCANEYKIIRTWSVTDCAGNNNLHTQVITVEDNTNPVFVGTLPANATVQCDAVPAAPVLTATDNCDNQVSVVYTESFSGQDDNCGSEYVITRTWSVSDCAGNSASHTQTINVEDNTNPVFVGQLPADATVQCDAVPAAPVLTASDNCDSQVSVVYTESFSGQDDSCGSEYVITRNWSVSDCAGNSASHTQTINVQDETNPVLIGELPANAIVQCDAVPVAPVLTATDNCDNNVSVVYTETFAGQDDGCGSVYVITRNWSVTDCAGNNASHTQTINVQDNTNPVLIGELPENITVQCDAVPVAPVISASDNCDNQVQVVYTETFEGQDDSCSAEYIITRKWEVTDCAGNKAAHTQVINVQDDTNPVFVGELPADATVQCDAVPVAPVITATDNCDNNVSVIYTEVFAGQDDNCSSEYVITRHWEVTDCAGNKVLHTQVINVEDTKKPEFVGELPADATVQCDAVPVAPVLTATDNCDNNVSVIYTETFAGQDDNCSSQYVITRNWSVTDCAGNNTSHTQIINVEDTTRPVFVEALPENATVQCDAVPTAPVLTATDNCDSQVQVVYTESFSGQDDSCGSEYVITRNWSVTDCSGNNTSHTQTINVEDNTNPLFVEALPESVTVQCDALPTAPVLTATDNCDSNVQVVYSEVINHNSEGCAGNYKIVRTWVATDCAGNASTHIQTITVIDNTPPTINVQPANLTVECDGSGNQEELNAWLASFAGASATDNCSTVTWSHDFASLSDDCGNTGSAVVTFTATDACGNPSTASATFTIQDTQAPTLIGDFPEVVEVTCSNIPDDQPEFEDTCSGVTVIPSEPVISNQTDFGYTVTHHWVATDACENITEITQVVNVTLEDPFTTVNSSLCIKDSTIDLFSLIDLSEEESNGTWVDVNQSGGLTGSMLDPSHIVPGFYVYHYEIDNGDCPRVIEVYMTISDDCIVLPCNINQLKISKVVTPNNDGANDFFRIGGLGECGFTYDVKIFNRWGSLVYEDHNYQNNWDGIARSSVSKGSNLPAGTYYYIVNVVDSGFDLFNGFIYLGSKN